MPSYPKQSLWSCSICFFKKTPSLKTNHKGRDSDLISIEHDLDISLCEYAGTFEIHSCREF